MVLVRVSEIETPRFQTVPADRSIRSVIEEMLARNFSQMGLIKDSELIGAISLRSIARALLVTEELFESPKNFGDRTAEIAVERPRIVHADDGLTDVLDALGERSYLLVEDEDTYRIITDYDVRQFWRRSTEPFLLIEEVEMALRSIIRNIYTDDASEALEQLTRDATHLETVTEVDQCSFGHYTRFISEFWSEGFSEYFDQQPDFIRELISRIGENRNQLFHFRIEDRQELDLDIIRFAHGYFTSLSGSQN